MQYILSLSYGKDSLACLGAIEQLNWPLDRIVHSEVWATDTLPADLPPMLEFKVRADAIIKARWGIPVERVRAERTAEQMFYHVRTRGNRAGERMGWPMVAFANRGCELQKALKVSPMNRLLHDAVTYLGIAADEPGRLKGLSEIRKSPLAAAGWTEARCRRWCEENGLLALIYAKTARSGCWFCPNQTIMQLRSLRRDYPELWALMLRWDADSPVCFKAHGHPLRDYDCRFQMEDRGLLLPSDTGFRWSKVDTKKEVSF